MIYAIGDIHGMYDPLKILVDYIYDSARKHETISKIIFLGDFIDCGPSSKQVIDLVLHLKQDFEVITLLGNHEEMLLSFYNKSYNFMKVGSYWLNYNGGLQTIYSFYPGSVLFKKELYPDERTVSDFLHFEDVLKLDKVYADFFLNLQSTYQVSLQQDEIKYDLLFSHSALSSRFTAEEQIAIQDWKGLHDFIDNNDIDLNETHIWNRQLLTQQLRENLIIIHGHTPTKYYRQMTKLLKFWEEEENTPYVVREKKNRQIAQIDIDTGLIYGGALTMLAIDDSPGAENIFPFYISVDPKRGFRHKLFSRTELDLI
jgi:serine/threonine protein phosphatase 1